MPNWDKFKYLNTDNRMIECLVVTVYSRKLANEIKEIPGTRLLPAYHKRAFKGFRQEYLIPLLKENESLINCLKQVFNLSTLNYY